MSENNASENIEGFTTDTGWHIGPRNPRAQNATGGQFSVCYTATKNGETCFLKAFNFAQFLNFARHARPERPVVDVLGDMIDAYKYERELSEICKRHHVTKVAFVRDAGELLVPGYSIAVVPYLVFDLADGGDVRTWLSFNSKLEAAWKLRSLHSVAVGLKQLHTIDVSHQDLKPSNVLLFRGESKIGDLGRSTAHALKSPLKDLPFPGDHTYAPPEILYGDYERNWRRRAFACDTYLFGSLIVFYFSGLTMTGLLRTQLHDSVSWENHRGSYDEVLPYVLDGFSRALDAFAQSVPVGFLRDRLRGLVERLCYPVPGERVYGPQGVAGTAIDLERVVSLLDVLATKARITFRSQPLADGQYLTR